MRCGSQTFWVADHGDSCGSLAVFGTGWSVLTPCVPLGAASHNASGMCLACWADESVGALSAFCASVGATGSGANSCCVSVVQERLSGATALANSCGACQKVGVCPQRNKNWASVSKDTKLEVCAAGGKVDNDYSGQPVKWCKVNATGVTALAVLLPLAFAAIVATLCCCFCPCCPYHKYRRAAMGMGAPGYPPHTMLVGCPCCPVPIQVTPRPGYAMGGGAYPMTPAQQFAMQQPPPQYVVQPQLYLVQQQPAAPYGVVTGTPAPQQL